MEVEGSAGTPAGQWSHLQRLLTRSGPLAHPEFQPSAEILELLRDTLRVLVVGAGGLGCELLKDLALMGFGSIDVIDMDTIDLSNLNRQFLFRQQDVGRPKAVVAAEFIHGRVPGCTVTPHFCKIQDYDEVFYRQFHVVVCGLDSILARRWINGMLVSLLRYEEDGSLDQGSVIPLVDGGTEGFKGNVRVILPGMSACIECTLDLFPPQHNFPLCTIAHTPRLPEHCVEYVRLLLWPKENPWGEGASIDGDDPAHLAWILERAQERAAEYGIVGVDYRLTQGVVKRIIPAVASTNAVIAAACATEVFKLATSCAAPMNNYMVFNDVDGIYTYTYEQERNEACTACSQRPAPLAFPSDARLETVLEHLRTAPQYQMKSPGVTTAAADGRNRTLYMATVPSIEQRTRPNLKKTLSELGLTSGQELAVADVTTPNTVLFRLELSDV
ncbi:NEDD8-activating enzyme E1 catalytic subunit-like [Pollicipes pollicipes]|uniref:NEDD8-activating enzyme E1 catalytic subunit-like n=1 Tax=Pollicipes pollicipes TaxID=41117 RepID=UPI001884E24B|nr:NEDD8-activating enzyme E1 catalytic subunit-like [Pollicipes pollicipes]XP_037086846.1 NEDD8-activating enzyme E1 catalytic subunit-like [Pollicipes pollicipes]XP_037086847.1 NEDD8-activating enzyme E1 catalytic subunit-like [Pollicipes pollicipes]